MKGSRICVVLLALMLVAIVIVPVAKAETGNGTVVLDNGISDSSNTTIVVNITMINTTISTPVSTATESPYNGTFLQIIVPTLTAIVSPVQTPPSGSTRIPENSTWSTAIPESNLTSIVISVNETDQAVPIAEPTVQARKLTPSVQRKISTNLLYIIDQDAPQRGRTQGQAVHLMREKGQMKTEQPVESSKSGVRAGTSQSSNHILVYVDLVKSASTNVVDPYMASITNRNEQEHYVVGWADANTIDKLASLDLVINIRTAEPSVTAESPVYRDTKPVGKQGMLTTPMSVEGAKDSVREFAKDPELSLTQKRTMRTPRGNVYELASVRGRFYVNSKTGDIELATFYDQSKSPTRLSMDSATANAALKQSFASITMDQAFAIAQDYAGKNYRNFYNRTMVLTESKLVDHGDAGKTYYFTWMEKINEVLIPNGVSVSINYENGNILSYIGLEQILNIDIVPTVTRDIALTKAFAAFSHIEKNVNVDTRLVVQPIDENIQRLVWIVDIYGMPNESISQWGQVVIDAHSGETVMKNDFI